MCRAPPTQACVSRPGWPAPGYTCEPNGGSRPGPLCSSRSTFRQSVLLLPWIFSADFRHLPSCASRSTRAVRFCLLVVCFPSALCTSLSAEFFRSRTPSRERSPPVRPGSVHNTPSCQLGFASPPLIPNIRLVTYFCHLCIPNSPQMSLIVPVRSAVACVQLTALDACGACH